MIAPQHDVARVTAPAALDAFEEHEAAKLERSIDAAIGACPPCNGMCQQGRECPHDRRKNKRPLDRYDWIFWLLSFALVASVIYAPELWRAIFGVSN